MYSPVIVGYTLFLVTGNKWHTSYATAYMVFWAGPFTPFFPLCIGIAFAIRKIIDKIFKRKDGK